MKWIVLFLTVFTFSFSHAEQDLPMPLPDDPPGQEWPEEPEQPEQPQPPAPRPPQQPPQNPQPPQKPQPPSNEVREYSLGAGDTGRFKERAFIFYPNSTWRHVSNISLTGTRNNVKIKEVIITYADYGDSRYETQLEGELIAGSRRTAYIQTRPIASIRIVASNKYFWKKPGGFRVDVSAYK
ncbi:hypothetical protein [Bdellovibrio sp. GT3]|uniref:hypothetical protein n=1 Tax=Bdellovibrio sp. GT3 TaxID=3136282 RepID=UPI0030F213F6